MSAANELLIKLKTIAELGGFDSLEGKVKKAATDMKGMENTTNAAAKKMKTDLDQVNNSNFSSLNNKFTSTIRSMVSTAASGAKAIKTSLEGMTDGIDGAITSVASGMGVMELFDKAMDKALTKTQLKNAKPQDYDSIMSQYQQFTTKSSASDDDISKMLRYTYSGNSSQTYAALNAIDAISYSADKLQRQEGIRGWGTYISGGWSAASGMMKDEPLTADQQKLLEGAKTYEERIKAMETIAQQKGNLDDKGNSLSTTTTGELGKYNTTLAAADSIMRGATSTMETFMVTITPLINGFNDLDPGIKNTLGSLITWGVLLTAGAAGLGILSRALSPVYNALNNLRTSSNKAVDASTDLVNGFDKSNKKISSSSNSFAGRMSKIAVKALAITAVSVALMGSINTVGGDTKTDLANAYDKIGDHKKAEEIRKGIPQPLKYGQAYDPNHTFKLPPQTQGTGTTEYSDKVPKNSTSVQAVSKSGLWDPSGILGLIGIKSPLDATQHMNQALDPFGINGWINSGVNWLTNSNPDQNKANLPQGPNLFSPASAASSSQSIKPSFQDDLKDLFDFSRFNITWPNVDAQGWANNNLVKPVTDGWNGAKNWVTQNPVIGGAITQVENLLKDPQKAWDDARSYVSHSIVGKAWADASRLYTNVKSWWDKAISYVRTNALHNEVSGTAKPVTVNALAGDEGADEGYGTGPYYEPVITTTSSSKTVKQTVIKAPIIIKSISNREEGDRAIRAVTNHLNQFNNDNGN